MRAVYKPTMLDQFRKLVDAAARDHRVIDYIEVTQSEFHQLEREINPHLLPRDPTASLKGLELQILGTRVKVLPASAKAGPPPSDVNAFRAYCMADVCGCSGLGPCFAHR